VDGKDAVGDEALAQGADDRDAARNAGLEEEMALVFLRSLEQLGPTLGEEGLVRGDDVLAVLQRHLDEVEGVLRAADQLDDDVETGIGGELAPVGSDEAFGHADFPGALGAAGGDLPHFDFGAKPLL